MFRVLLLASHLAQMRRLCPLSLFVPLLYPLRLACRARRSRAPYAACSAVLLALLALLQPMGGEPGRRGPCVAQRDGRCAPQDAEPGSRAGAGAQRRDVGARCECRAAALPLDAARRARTWTCRGGWRGRAADREARGGCGHARYGRGGDVSRADRAAAHGHGCVARAAGGCSRWRAAHARAGATPGAAAVPVLPEAGWTCVVGRRL